LLLAPPAGLEVSTRDESTFVAPLAGALVASVRSRPRSKVRVAVAARTDIAARAAATASAIFLARLIDGDHPLSFERTRNLPNSRS
jgi:hypothetical protein